MTSMGGALIEAADKIIEILPKAGELRYATQTQ